MLRKTNVHFPNEYDNGEVTFPINGGRVFFLDVIRTLRDRLMKPDLPLGRLCVKINDILWRPEAYLYNNGKSITDNVGSYDEVYSLYSPPVFMTPYMMEDQVLTSPYLSEEEFNSSVVKFDYYANIDIVDTTPQNNLSYRIMVPSRIVKRMKLVTDDMKCGDFPYIWELIVELNPDEYNSDRMAEWAYSHFVDCIVMNNRGERQYINMDHINTGNVASSCDKISALLNMDTLLFSDFAQDELQHPVTEFYMFKRWGDEAIPRLQSLLTRAHAVPYSKSNRRDLEQFLLTYVKLCTRAEASSVRPPSWPYRNPNMVNEDFFISSCFNKGCGCAENIHDFMEAYAVVEEVAYLNAGCIPYNLIT
jgi:hypothetical protein